MICRGAVFPEGKPYSLGNFAWVGGESPGVPNSL